MRNLITRVVVLSLALAMVAPLNEAMAQNRRSATNSGSTTTQKSSQSSSSSRSQSSTSYSRSNSSQNKKSSASKSVTTSSSRSTDKKATTTSSVRRSNSSSSSNSAVRSSSSSSRSSSSTVRSNSSSSRNNSSAVRSGSSSSRNNSSAVSSGSSSSRNSGTVSTSRVNRGNSSTSSSSNRGTAVNTTQSRRVSSTSSVSRDNSSTSRRVGIGVRDDNRRPPQYDGNNKININPRNHEVVGVRNNIPPKRDSWKRPYMREDRKPRPNIHHGHHYYGYRVKTLPIGHTVVHFGGVSYHFHNGIYYRPYGVEYVICRPPVGAYFARSLFDLTLTSIKINMLTNAARKAARAAALAAEYAAINSSYRVRTASQIAETIAYDNQDYYYDDGVFYIIKNGNYYVIEPPVGALVTQLPYDYEVITLRGEDYYMVDNALYEVVVIDGNLYFQVMCVL